MGSSSDEDVQVLIEQSEGKAVEFRVREAKGRRENVRIADVPSNINEGEFLDVCSMYNIMPEYKLARPSKYTRANEPLDSESIMLYEEDFQSRVRLPLSEPLKSFFSEYDITISQLHPNGLRFLCGIVELACRDETVVTAGGGLRSANLRQVIVEGYPIYSPSGRMRPNPSPAEMSPKKAKASKMSKITEAMNKKAEAKRFDKGIPLVILDPPADNAGVVSEFAHVKYVATIPSIEPSRKRPREVTVPIPPPFPS
ncbi:hypothetical protein JCGZ_00507 [Jatropha curcas]|uniref:Uncharacterized protein n=1 Tax=Jatropha curcas TaxID=180498 RepID=A0A067JGQ1_JATCU|nr:hypothetical protein JCGZ_00507 [Jatropha curcas]